jgi:hypothetical protein
MASISFRGGTAGGCLSLSVNQDSGCLAVGTSQGFSIFNLETGALLYKNASLGALG